MSKPKNKGEKPQASPARGAPRPLAAHVLAGAGDFQNGVTMAVAADDRRFPWRPSMREEAAEIAEAFAGFEPSAVRDAVAAEALADFSAALEGMASYQDSPPLRRPAEPPVVWRDGAARLLDYSGFCADPKAPVALVLPSLVNGPWILDLSRARSFLRGLAAAGVRPYLLDWGDPGVEERAFALSDYVERRALPAVRQAARLSGAKQVGVIGHCMSGALAAATAFRAGRDVSRFVLMAAPWDFRSLRPPENARPRRADLERLIDACGAVFGGAPSDILNTLFFLRDPLQAVRKFPGFARKGRDSAFGRMFVAVEDWLGEGPRLSAPAARTLFLDWALDDDLSQGRWRVAGERFDPGKIKAPALVVASRSDTVAPYESASAAAKALPSARLITPSGGHVGMVVGSRARAELWEPVAEFLQGGR